MKRSAAGSFFALLALAAAGAFLAYWTNTNPLSDRWPLAIDSADGTHRFMVELALAKSEQAQGLMFRKELADDAGMLFVYDRPGVRSMWMKNTPLSLDMLFIDPNGEVLRVVRDTVPFSTTSIFGPRNSRYVLELRAGVTRRLGIRAGDQVQNLPVPGQPSPSSSR